MTSPQLDQDLRRNCGRLRLQPLTVPNVISSIGGLPLWRWSETVRTCQRLSPYLRVPIPTSLVPPVLRDLRSLIAQPNKRLKLAGAALGGIAFPRRRAFVPPAPPPCAGGDRPATFRASRVAAATTPTLRLPL